MCLPVAAVGLITTVVSTAASAVSSAQQASAQEEAYNRNAAKANEQATESFFQTSARQLTEAENSAQRIQDIERDAAEAKAIAATRMAEGGLTGNSAAAVIQEFARDEGDAIARERRNRHLQITQGEFEKRATHLRTEASILAAQPSGVQGPDFIGAALSIGASASELLYEAPDSTVTNNGVNS